MHTRLNHVNYSLLLAAFCACVKCQCMQKYFVLLFIHSRTACSEPPKPKQK